MHIDEAAVRANATRLRELYARIDESLPYRSSSPSGRRAWETACKVFHTRFNDLFFPGGLAGWEAFIARQSEGIAAAILFLEVDPVVFRSGYIKEIIWHKLKQSSLSERERFRLELVARGYLKNPLRREFWHMVRYVRLRGSPSFWSNIEELASQPERSEVAVRAGWLMLARQNFPVRNRLGYERSRSKWQPGASPHLDLWTRSTEA